MLVNERVKLRYPRLRTSATQTTRASPSTAVSISPPPTAAASTPTMVRRRRQVIHASDVNSAKEYLRERLEHPAPFVGEDGDPYWGPSVVCAATTWEDFKRWLNVNEGRLKRWDFEPLNDGTNRGRVVVYSLPSFVHENASDEIRSSITTQIQIAGNNVPLGHTVRDGRPTCQIGDSGQEPDASLIPRDLEVGGAVLAASEDNPFPNVIIEVAYKNESLEDLRAKLRRWMSDDTSVQVAIGIKIFPGAMTKRRVAILHQRGQPTQEVDFGYGYPPAPPLTFPVGAIYAGVALPAGLNGNHPISINLDELRTVINITLHRSNN